MASSPARDNRESELCRDKPFFFSKNDPYDKMTPVELVIPSLVKSADYMASIRSFPVPADAIAVWYLGQNGFILKSSEGPLIGIDLYLTNSCSTKFGHLPFRLERQLPIFIEPEDLDVDVFITTHSHDDHADPETIRRMRSAESTLFLGPFDSIEVYRNCGVPVSCLRLIHPGESFRLSSSITVQATFALPTDDTDLNHIGVLLRFANGITFFNTGDTAYAVQLASLWPRQVDVCAICINGGFQNLSVKEAAALLNEIKPRVAIPCHYDMLVNNTGSPKMLRVALDLIGCDATVKEMQYYQPWVFQKV